MSKHDTLATGSQMGLIFKLMEERDCNKLSYDQREYLNRLAAGDFTLTMNAASKTIDALFELPKSAKGAGGPRKEPLEAGVYRKDNNIFKVQQAVHGSGGMYAKRLMFIDGASHESVDGEDHWIFQYEPGAISLLKPEHKMSLEDAKEFGQVYGVCVRCGATLTDENSIAAGIGPICATKF